MILGVVSTNTNPAQGELFGRYRLLESLGEGGMAVVYRAVTEGPQGFSREVVVKRIREDLSRDESFVRMLLAEAKLCALLKHPGIVQVHELGEVEGEYFIAMELVDGHDLSSVILRAQKIRHQPPVGVICYLVQQVAEALAYAHTLTDHEGRPLQIVHRDVSPSNVMVTPHGVVKLVDFGVARAMLGEGDDRTRTGTLKGKIGYLSPEQADGLQIDQRSDIFALGIVFHELLTLQRLFRGEDDLKTLRLIRETEVLPPDRDDLAPEVSKLLMQMLARNPSQRPQTCQEIVDRLQPIVHRMSVDHGALKRWLDQLAPIPSRHMIEARTRPDYVKPGSKPSTLNERPQRRWNLRWAAAFVVGLAVAIGGGALIGRMFHRPPASAARTHRTVAVTGFKNLSGRTESAWLATALSEMITTELDGSETIRTSNDNRSADLLLDGAYLALGNAGQVRLDLRLSDRRGATVTTMSESGTESQLMALVARVGTQLRTKLGEKPPEHATTTSLPSNPEAARLYTEGLEQLRLMDCVSARDRLSRAAALDPQNPLILALLSAAEDGLGHTVNSLNDAKRAFDLSQKLSPSEKLPIEARYRVVTKEWAQAITAYRSLFALHPESLEDGILLAQTQILALKANDALSTVAALRKLPGSADEPRVDLVEAMATNVLSLPKRALVAAQAARQKATTRGAPLVVARALLAEGKAEWASAHGKEATTALNAAERTFGAAGDGAGRAATLVLLSDLQYSQGKMKEARRSAEEAMAVSQKLGDQRGLISAMTVVANLIGETEGGEKESLAMYERILVMCKSIDDRSCQASMYNNKGGVAQGQRHLKLAKENYAKAAEILSELHVADTAIVALANLASVLFDLGDLEGARNATERAVTFIKQSGTKGDSSWALYYLARTLAAQGEFDSARKNFDEAVRFDQQQGKDSERAAARAAIAELLLEQKKIPEAETVARDALELAKGHPNAANLGFGSEMQVSEVLARILLAQNRLDEAANLIERAKKVVPPNPDPDWAMMLAVSDARIQVLQGNTKSGLAALQKELSRTEDYVFHKLWIRLAQVELGHGDGKSLARDARKSGFEVIARRAERAR
jgi:serine/threonine protein kinase/tetratricopeptide (TPR) repeat protein